MPTELLKIAQRLPSVFEKKGELFCSRCHSQIDKERNLLPIGAYYCRECILLGRVRSDEDLYYFFQESFPIISSLKWLGQLTEYQERVSKGLLEGVQSKQDTLVHAVTGAGKTEMIYQVVAQMLDQGGAVCIASPRIDVCFGTLPAFKRRFFHVIFPYCMGSPTPIHAVP